MSNILKISVFIALLSSCSTTTTHTLTTDWSKPTFGCFQSEDCGKMTGYGTSTPAEH